MAETILRTRTENHGIKLEGNKGQRRSSQTGIGYRSSSIHEISEKEDKRSTQTDHRPPTYHEHNHILSKQKKKEKNSNTSNHQQEDMENSKPTTEREGDSSKQAKARSSSLPLAADLPLAVFPSPSPLAVISPLP